MGEASTFITERILHISVVQRMAPWGVMNGTVIYLHFVRICVYGCVCVCVCAYMQYNFWRHLWVAVEFACHSERPRCFSILVLSVWSHSIWLCCCRVRLVRLCLINIQRSFTHNSKWEMPHHFRVPEKHPVLLLSPLHYFISTSHLPLFHFSFSPRLQALILFMSAILFLGDAE